MEEVLRFRHNAMEQGKGVYQRISKLPVLNGQKEADNVTRRQICKMRIFMYKLLEMGYNRYNY